MAPKPSTQPTATTAATTDAPAGGEIAVVAASTTAPAATPARTPETVPVPGGGQWGWDSERLDWVSRNPKPTEPPADEALTA